LKNILFVLADCLRADSVFGGKRQPPTPALDRLKRQGVSFTQVISSATMTSPCVSSLFTGCYPLLTGIHALRGDVLNPALPTLAELLKARGYQTHALMTGPLWEGLGVERGFETFEYRKPGPLLSEEWRDRIRVLITNSAGSRPWFLYAHFFDLHVPRVIAPHLNRAEYGATMYERAFASLDYRLGEILADVDWDDTIVVFHADHGELFPQTPWLETRERIWQDFILGKKPPFMRFGIKRDPTVRAWTNLKRATKMGHGFNLSEGLVRVPLIISGTGHAPSGQVITAQARQVDIMPTLVDLAGFAPPANLSGASLLPVIRETESSTRPAYMEARAFGRDPDFFMRGIRTPDWKFIDSPSDKRVKPQLYSMTADRFERHNVLRLYPDVGAEMSKLMDKEAAPFRQAEESKSWSPEEARVVEDRLRDLGYF
jgi:arylsulfatase A-like enzyme